MHLCTNFVLVFSDVKFNLNRHFFHDPQIFIWPQSFLTQNLLEPKMNFWKPHFFVEKHFSGPKFFSDQKFCQINFSFVQIYSKPSSTLLFLVLFHPEDSDKQDVLDVLCIPDVLSTQDVLYTICTMHTRCTIHYIFHTIDILPTVDVL